MITKFLYLEWKSLIRSASFKTNLAFKIFMGLVALYFLALFLSAGVLAFYGLKKAGFEPLETINKFLIYYIFADLLFRYFMQKVPTITIRPLMVLPFKKKTVVHFSLGKTLFSFFNLSNALFFIPFTVILLFNGYNVLGVLLWHLGVMTLLLINNFLNILINSKDSIFWVVVSVVVGLGLAQYYGYFDITKYTFAFFQGMYTNYNFILPVLLLVGVYYYTFSFYKKDFTLDARLAIKKETATTENLTWLNQFGTLGTFLKNDIKLIKRNKRSKTTIYMSLLFLFYGLIFFTNDMYSKGPMVMFAAVFVTGGFLINFGQFVPSWDSAFYQLMMTQNVSYKNYLNSKWWLMIIGTAVSMVLSSFYLYFGLNIYLIILAGGIYNIGVNSYLVLFTGSFTKTPIDLDSGKGAFGDKKAFNVKTLLFSLPQMLIPVLIYWVGVTYDKVNLALITMVILGIVGLAFKQQLFDLILKIYKKEKYKTISAYKQKN